MRQKRTSYSSEKKLRSIKVYKGRQLLSMKEFYEIITLCNSSWKQRVGLNEPQLERSLE